ncbi:hypothetical protein [Streptomyces griseoflavus]|uniref:hypothetical protein n=1 Tax=Streptomyces griseoflavus TaxID=35619 RepID=UPI0033DFB032
MERAELGAGRRGTVQFAIRMRLGRFDACPLGHASLWNRTDVFVSWREQERRLAAGLDPCTGEPDPCAHLFPVPRD